jgi:hypothetical protein
MVRPTGGCDEAANLLLHDAINQLAVIVGNCDLLRTELQAGSESAKRLGRIHKAAVKMAERIEQYQRRVLEVVRIVGGRKRDAA